jgi:hypothetical protein
MLAAVFVDCRKQTIGILDLLPEALMQTREACALMFRASC